MRRERRNGLAHISPAHWLPANFPEEPITLRTNQASLERHQVKLLRPIFSLSPRLPSRVSLKVRFTMAIHPLCGDESAPRSPSAAGLKRGIISRVKEAFIREEESRIHVKREREWERVWRTKSSHVGSNGIDPGSDSLAAIRHIRRTAMGRILEIHCGLLPKFLTFLLTSLVDFHVRDSSRVAHGISASIILLRSEQLSATCRFRVVEILSAGLILFLRSCEFLF